MIGKPIVIKWLYLLAGVSNQIDGSNVLFNHASILKYSDNSST